MRSLLWIPLLLLLACGEKPQAPEENPPEVPQTAPEPERPRLSACQQDLAAQVQSVAERLHEQAFAYSSADTADCSGMFHRLLWELEKACPEIAHPPFTRYRSSRQLARWYHEQGKLRIITDPLQAAGQIHSGAVMFYGFRGKKIKEPTFEGIFSGIEHIGMVVEVKTDASGQLSSYTLFHGRTSRNPAGITDFHRREPSRKAYPPYGNGKQKWVALAEL
jgi:hypothetical protein